MIEAKEKAPVESREAFRDLIQRTLILAVECLHDELLCESLSSEKILSVSEVIKVHGELLKQFPQSFGPTESW